MTILDGAYTKVDLKQVADNTTHIDTEEITQLLRQLKYFEGLFYGPLGYRDTDPVDLDLNPNSKPYLGINKETFYKELQGLVKIGVLFHKQQSQ